MPKLVSSWAASVLLKLARYQAAETRGTRFLQLAEGSRSRIVEVAPRDAVTFLKEGALLIDVREREEFIRGHIPHAWNQPRGTIELEIEKKIPSLEQKIVVYCGAGNRSALVADNLQRMGYSAVKSIQGGFQNWLDAGYPAWRGSPLIED